MKTNQFALILLSLCSINLTGCMGMRACRTGGLGQALACSGGCGEVYVDEYINHPPVCDPCGGCDSCGGGCGTSVCGGCDDLGCGGCGDQFTGARCTPCRPILSRLSQFWGIRYIPASDGNFGLDSGCGCDTCGADYDYGSPIYGGDVYESGYMPPSSGCNCGHAGTTSMMPGPVSHSHAPAVPTQSAMPSVPASSTPAGTVGRNTNAAKPRVRPAQNQPTKSRLVNSNG